MLPSLIDLTTNAMVICGPAADLGQQQDRVPSSFNNFVQQQELASLRIMSCLNRSAGGACVGLAIFLAIPTATALPLSPANTSPLTATGDQVIIATAGKNHHRKGRHHRHARDVEVDALTTYVRRRGRNVDVEAPFTSVQRSRSRVRVRAPFVDLWVPRR